MSAPRSGAPFATLRSFTRAGRATAPSTEAAAVLRSITERPRPQPGEACEMCGESIGTEHSHVADLENRSLMCTCRGCYLLFTRSGAGGGRRVAVPETYARDPTFDLTPQQWEALQIPVDLVFIFAQSDLGHLVACYPSASGATESTLDVDDWQDVMSATPMLADLEPDVEAALVRRHDGGFECFRVPIDACYELVGIVRRHWTGFHGGDEVWAKLDEFFDDIRRRCGEARRREPR